MRASNYPTLNHAAAAVVSVFVRDAIVLGSLRSRTIRGWRLYHLNAKPGPDRRLPTCHVESRVAVIRPLASLS